MRHFIGTYIIYPFISDLIFTKLKAYKFDVIHAHDAFFVLGVETVGLGVQAGLGIPFLCRGARLVRVPAGDGVRPLPQ